MNTIGTCPDCKICPEYEKEFTVDNVEYGKCKKFNFDIATSPNLFSMITQKEIKYFRINKDFIPSL